MRDKRLWVFWALALLGCEDMSRSRVNQDGQVGLAGIDAADIRVHDGLATVRRLEDGLVQLWAQAPSLSMDLTVHPGARQVWEISILNCMPGALLSAQAPGGVPVPVTELGPVRATALRWQVELPPGVTTHLEMGTPGDQTKEPFRFAVLSDIQSAIDEFSDMVDRLNQDSEIRFVLSTGDLVDSGERGQLERFQEELERLQRPYFSTVGNHEGFSGRPETWAELFGRASFHFTFKGAHFSLVDSGSATVHPTVYGWLRDWLSRAQGQKSVVLTHIPPLDPSGTRSGAFASRKEAAKLIKLLADHDVDVTFYGHIHSYYAFSNGGIPAYISGGGGAIPERLDGIGRHFLTVDVIPWQPGLTVSLVRVD